MQLLRFSHPIGSDDMVDVFLLYRSTSFSIDEANSCNVCYGSNGYKWHGNGNGTKV
jgi:hypothetical protein